MIDIEELRHLAEKAASGPWYTGNGTYEGRNIYSVESVTDNEGFTYQPVIATVEDNDSPLWAENTTFIAAANPAVVIELLDRLEHAESEIMEHARILGMGGEREAALMAKLEAAETAWKVSDKSCYDLTEKVIPKLRDQIEAAENERDALRAKIGSMERQEPIAYVSVKYFPDVLSSDISKYLPVGTPLYLAAGAQGEEK